jgi:voltage-gated potassium channel
MSERDDRSRLEALASIPLFEGLPSDVLRDILDRVTEFEVERGHVLVQPQQPGEGLFVIEQGEAVVDLPGRRVSLGPGEFFGELALLNDNALRSARVSAATRLTGLALRRDDFDSLLESRPEMAVSMLRVLARRMASLTEPAG